MGRAIAGAVAFLLNNGLEEKGEEGSIGKRRLRL